MIAGVGIDIVIGAKTKFPLSFGVTKKKWKTSKCLVICYNLSP